MKLLLVPKTIAAHDALTKINIHPKLQIQVKKNWLIRKVLLRTSKMWKDASSQGLRGSNSTLRLWPAGDRSGHVGYCVGDISVTLDDVCNVLGGGRRSLKLEYDWDHSRDVGVTGGAAACRGASEGAVVGSAQKGGAPMGGAPMGGAPMGGALKGGRRRLQPQVVSQHVVGSGGTASSAPSSASTSTVTGKRDFEQLEARSMSSTPDSVEVKQPPAAAAAAAAASLPGSATKKRRIAPVLVAVLEKE